MTQKEYDQIEQYMLSLMKDSAHDRQHIYRVLYVALDIAKTEPSADTDILITACLLHDIGREKQFKNPSLCHAVEGAKMAYEYLVSIGWSEDRAAHVRDAITTHRFRSNNEPQSIEAKILFDADKADVAGTLGIARTLMYRGNKESALYSVDDNGKIIDGENDKNNTFFNEYKFKLEKIYDRFYTKRGREIAEERRKSAVSFWNSLYGDIKEMHENGAELLKESLK